MPVTRDRALIRSQLRKLLLALLGVLDNIQRADRFVSIDNERAQKPLGELLEISGELRLSSRDDLEAILLGTFPPPASIVWPHIGEVRYWSDVKRLMHQGFDLVLEDDNCKRRPTYVLYHGEYRAPGNDVLPQCAIVSAGRRGQLPEPTKLADGSHRYHFDQNTSAKPRARKGRKSNAARL